MDGLRLTALGSLAPRVQPDFCTDSAALYRPALRDLTGRHQRTVNEGRLGMGLAFSAAR